MLPGRAAQLVQRHGRRLAGTAGIRSAIDHQPRLVDRGPHALVSAEGEPGEVFGRGRQGCRLAVPFIAAAQLVDGAAGGGQRLPGVQRIA